MDRTQLVKRIDQSWQDLLSSYAGLSGQELQEPGVMGSWTIKDVIAHITWWEEEALTHLPLIMEDKKLPRYRDKYGGIDAFNDRMVEEKRKLSLKEVLRERDETHRRLLDFLHEVPDEHFVTETRFRKRLRLDTYGHYKIHTAAIHEWREKKT